MSGKPIILLVFTIAAAISPAHARLDYKFPENRVHKVYAICEGERISVSHTTRGPIRELGINDLRINGIAIAKVELAKVETLLNGQRLALLQILGCRRTRAGDVRHWFQADPVLSAENVNDPVRSKWFYVRRGKIEVHKQQPVD